MPKRDATRVVALADGEAVVMDCRGFKNLTIITGSGATATYSRVDSRGKNNSPATAGPALTAAVFPVATTGTENGATVAATTKLLIPIDWAYFRVSTASGPCRVCLAGE